jgi:hypothetical protein
MYPKRRLLFGKIPITGIVYLYFHPGISNSLLSFQSKIWALSSIIS